jgi:hypothetical protein
MPPLKQGGLENVPSNKLETNTYSTIKNYIDSNVEQITVAKEE